MAVSAAQIQGKITLKKARAQLYNGVVAHDHEKVRKAITDIRTLDGNLNKPWSTPADTCDDVRPPIVLAAYNHNLEAMRLLLNTNTIDLSFESRGKTPTMLDVCRTGNEKVVAMLLKRGGSLNVQASYNILPLDAAFFASMQFNYSVVFHSDWGSLELKRRLIAWWQGEEFTPEAPLQARWPGAIPLVALVLKQGANPAIEDSCGISPLKVVREPTCLLKNAETLMTVELPKVVKFSSHNEGILTFKVVLKDRSTRRRLEIMVDVDYNMKLPAEVDRSLSQDILDVLTSKKTRTMRGLIEAFAPKDKPLVQEDGLLDIKRRMELVEISAHVSASGVQDLKKRVEGAAISASAAAAQAAAAIQFSDGVQRNLNLLHEQHVVVYQEHQERKAYQERLAAIEADKSSGRYQFFDAAAKGLDQLFDACKLGMKAPSKLDKGELAARGIEALSGFLPAPFNTPGKAIAFLIKTYSAYRQGQERNRVVNLLPLDHKPMCRNLALQLSERYSEVLTQIDSQKAQKLGKNAVGVIFMLMSDPEKTVDPHASFEHIEKELFAAICTSEFFQKELKGCVEPAESRSWLPGFLRKKESPPEPRSKSQPPKPKARDISQGQPLSGQPMLLAFPPGPQSPIPFSAFPVLAGQLEQHGVAEPEPSLRQKIPVARPAGVSMIS